LEHERGSRTQFLQNHVTHSVKDTLTPSYHLQLLYSSSRVGTILSSVWPEHQPCDLPGSIIWHRAPTAREKLKHRGEEAAAESRIPSRTLYSKKSIEG